MNTKRNVGILVFLGSILVMMAAHATLSLSEGKIVKGTTIEVFDTTLSVQSILNGITDAGPMKPYLIKLGPGEYTITADGTTGFGIEMIPYVSIMGSGQGVTIFKGAISSVFDDGRSAIVIGASNASLTDLSVENTGLSSFSIAILNFLASPRIQNVTATVSGAANNNFAVVNDNSSPTISHVTATASGGADSNFAMLNGNSSPTMSHVTATASGNNSFGMQFVLGAPQVDSSTLSGDTGGVRIFNNGVRITNTRIVGGVTIDDAATNCLNTYDENLVAVSC